MKTIPISIHTKHISALSSEYPLERTLWRIGLTSLVILVCAYAYFVTASVLHVIQREEAMTATERLSVTTAKLEQEFFEKTKLLTRERGSDMGLVPVSFVSYVQSRNAMVEATQSSVVDLP